MINKFQKGIVTIVILLSAVCAEAKNLGVFGQTYPIVEEDFLEFIQNRLMTMQQNGEWQALQNKLRDSAAKKADRPQPVLSVSKTLVTTSWHYDPSITVPYDLHDSEGHVFAIAGTTINPLNYVALSKTLIFYDADDKTQVKWVQKRNSELNAKTKLILVNGSVTSQEKIFHQRIYFDQQGKLVEKFHITHVPAELKQEEGHLTISEVVP